MAVIRAGFMGMQDPRVVHCSAITILKLLIIF